MDAAGEAFPLVDLRRLHAALGDFKKWKSKTPFERCLFWRAECERPIGSHSLSECWLRHFASENHVVVFKLNADKAGRHLVDVSAERIGVTRASVFPGFCAAHDRTLFASLDTLNFQSTRDSLLALAYRSTCQSACVKFQVVGASLKQPGFLRGESLRPFEAHVVKEMRATVDLLARKQQLEQALDDGTNRSFSHFVVEFRGALPFSASVTFRPAITATGKRLQLRDDWVSMTVLPTLEGGAAVLSWQNGYAKNANLLIKSIRSVPRNKIVDFLLLYTLEHAENAAFSPDWWNALPASRQLHFKQRFGRSLGGELPKGDIFRSNDAPMIRCDDVTLRIDSVDV